MAPPHSCLRPRRDVSHGPSTVLALHGAATRFESLSDQNKLLSRCELSRLAPHPTGTACPMRSTTGIQEENDCGVNYFWRRLSQIPPRSRTGWMVIPQTAQVYAHRLLRLETLPSVCENSAGGMLLRDPLPFALSFWPFFFGHCLLSLFLLSCQVSTAHQARRLSAHA